MARTKLAQGKMTEAAKLAEEVIGDANFSLADFDQIFRGKQTEKKYSHLSICSMNQA